MKKSNELYRLLFEEAKKQYNSDEIDKVEYNNTLHLLLDKISDLENSKLRSTYILKTFENPNFRINVNEIINVTLAMN